MVLVKMAFVAASVRDSVTAPDGYGDQYEHRVSVVLALRLGYKVYRTSATVSYAFATRFPSELFEEILRGYWKRR